MDLKKPSIDASKWSKVSLEEFANTCLNGFGSMNKNDYEVAMFHALLQNELRDKSDFDISVLLRIPEAKIKRLRYEEALRYPSKDDGYYKDTFIDLLENGKFRVTDNNRIQFAISDKLFRLYINDLLMRGGRFADTSFNPNIVSLPWKDLEYLLDEFGINDKERQKKIEDSAKETEKEFSKTFFESLKAVAPELAKSAGKKIAGKVGERFIDDVFDKMEDLINKK